jgi:C-terminal processing protease CtpA/Prc
LLAACGGSSTPVVNTPTETATVKFIATPTPAATATTALEISPTASAYLEAALDLIQNNSLHRQSVDWDALRTRAFQMAEHAQTPADTYGTIRYVLSVLGDHHSFFLTPDAIAQRQQAAMSDSPAPRGKLLLDRLGFISIAGFKSVDMEEGAKYATIAQQLIRDLDAQDPCGWIVDLRENTGGNVWPMLAGLGPILGEGKAGASVGLDGFTMDWSYQDGQALDGDAVRVQVNGPAYQLKAGSPPVAVLTGVNTASSGEAIVVAFRGRPQTRSFGNYTTGLTTGNSGFPLSDGAVIFLTTVVFADRTGQTYGDRIVPDEVVDDVRKFTFLMEEAIPQPAIDWLMAQSACTAQE